MYKLTHLENIMDIISSCEISFKSIDATKQELQSYLAFPEQFKTALAIQELYQNPSEHFDAAYLSENLDGVLDDTLEKLVKNWDKSEESFVKLGDNAFRESLASKLTQLENVISYLNTKVLKEKEMAKNAKVRQLLKFIEKTVETEKDELLLAKDTEDCLEGLNFAIDDAAEKYINADDSFEEFPTEDIEELKQKLKPEFEKSILGEI
eukprot:UN24822